jgi:N-glycosylase/DNA lyase
MRVMKDLILKINNLKASKINILIQKRANEFVNFKRNNKNLFSELCFCLLTANFNAEKSINIQNKIGNGFLKLSEEELSKKLKKLGHRYPNTRANFIYLARVHKDSLKDKINSFDSDEDRREWLVKNIKGLGYKEASHFLRNIGYKDYAIIDFHIIDVLEREGLIQDKPKTLNRKKYIKIEAILRKLAKKLKMNLAELDLYLWYLETGKVLK